MNAHELIMAWGAAKADVDRAETYLRKRYGAVMKEMGIPEDLWSHWLALLATERTTRAAVLAYADEQRRAA